MAEVNRFLVDTNIWLERLLNQEKSEEVKEFLDTVPLPHLFLSDFSLHSIGVILCRKGKNHVFESFINDLFPDDLLTVLTLNPIELLDAANAIKSAKLDFDDAYQLMIAKKYKLALVTYDKNFRGSGIDHYAPSVILPQISIDKNNSPLPSK